MARDARILHPDFTETPYWWEAIRMGEDAPGVPLPPSTDVAVVGGGYAGLSAALELARNGVAATVIEAEDLGWGASTRNGGQVSGGLNIGKGLANAKARGGQSVDEMKARLLADAAQSYNHLETVIEREAIGCHYERRGRFVGAFTPKHWDGLAARVETLNRHAESGAYMVERARQREEIASDYYHGGMIVERSGAVHPALLHRGLIAAAERAGAALVARTRAGRIRREGEGLVLETSAGAIRAREVVIATNGYTGGLTPELRRRLIPVGSHIIATEPMDPARARALIPKGRTIADTRRILCYYRLSPDGTRVLFGGRARFTPAPAEASAPVLWRYMVDRWPQLRDVRVTHAWTGNVAFTFDYLPHMGRHRGIHFALGCNGSGVAMMTWLGHQTARKVLGGQNAVTAFDLEDFPTRPLYAGKPWFLPLVGSWYRMRDRIDRALA